ncbi:MAG: Rieske 2Fe-2S domain-containing protein, partial [Alphaproteobacteria bacterium]|nr:Rieske 2Fe-2S domain-containing protein [Alphaproteobacteria bacterium]
ACRHRGLPLAGKGDGGAHGNCKAQGFICPFHGWRWNAEGENTFVYGRHLFDERQLDAGDLALRPCRHEEAIGCVFINFDDNAPTLVETWGPILGKLETRLQGDQRAEWWYATELPANWKTAMEAFMEGYHVMRTHPQLQRAVPGLYNSMYGHDTGGIGDQVNPNWTKQQNIDAQLLNLELLSDGMAGMIHAKEVAIARTIPADILPDDPMQMVMHWFGAVQHAIHATLSAQGENVPDLNALAVSDPIQAVEFLFPHYFLLPFFTSTSAYRIRPTGPETCLFEIWSLTHFVPGTEPAPVMEPTVLPYDSDQFPPIPRQDYSNIPIQQKGLHAHGFDFMRLSKNIEGMISNYNRIIDGHLAGVTQAKLAAATQTLGGNFDGKIHDYDF